MKKTLFEKVVIPTLIVTKHPGPIGKLNPNVKISVYPLNTYKGHLPDVILTVVSDQYKPWFERYKVTEKPTARMLSGFPAAHMQVRYQCRLQTGRKIRVVSDLWVIKRTRDFILISTGTHRRDKKTRAALTKRIEAMKISGANKTYTKP